MYSFVRPVTTVAITHQWNTGTLEKHWLLQKCSRPYFFLNWLFVNHRSHIMTWWEGHVGSCIHLKDLVVYIHTWLLWISTTVSSNRQMPCLLKLGDNLLIESTFHLCLGFLPPLQVQNKRSRKYMGASRILWVPSAIWTLLLCDYLVKWERVSVMFNNNFYNMIFRGYDLALLTTLVSC